MAVDTGDTQTQMAKGREGTGTVSSDLYHRGLSETRDVGLTESHVLVPSSAPIVYLSKTNWAWHRHWNGGKVAGAAVKAHLFLHNIAS